MRSTGALVGACSEIKVNSSCPVNAGVIRQGSARLMIPKSTVKMTPGDFCFVPRTDDRFALFIYLCPQGTSRSYFYGALATVVVDEPNVANIPAELQIGDHALIHIHCYRENDTPIHGNLANRIGPEVFRQVTESVDDMTIGARHKVWGHRTIIKRANMVQA